MKNKLIIIVSLCAFYSCASKKQQDINGNKDYNFELISLTTELDAKAHTYADSLMSWEETGVPSFLTQNDFEISHWNYWESPYKPISTRWLILQGINKLDILEGLIDLEISEDKQIVNPYYVKSYFPYIDYSFMELVKMRKDELIQIGNISLD